MWVRDNPPMKQGEVMGDGDEDGADGHMRATDAKPEDDIKPSFNTYENGEG